MSVHRISIVLLHTWYHFTHSMETWVDVFWNSALQMLVFSFLALTFNKGANEFAGVYVIVGMIFWNVIWTAQYSLTVGVLWEIWSKSFSSMFISPLTFEEFLIGNAISGIIKAAVAVGVTAIIGYSIYQFSIFIFGWVLALYFVEFLIFGWASGMLVLSLILRFGVDVQSLSWSIVFLVQPFGAVFYPASALPPSIRWVAWGFPTTYLFESMRQQVRLGSINWEFIGIGTILNIVYLVSSYLLLRFTHNASKRSGAFARMEN